MLKSIQIKSFKSLENVSVDLGVVNVFIGANGSGKSNLLEAIGILGAAASGRVDDESLLRRGVRPGLPVLYKSSFKDTRQQTEISFAAKNDNAEFAVGLFNPLQNPESAWNFKTESLIENNKRIVGRSPRLKIPLDPFLGYTALKAVELPEGSASQLLSLLRNYAIYSPDTATLRGLDTDPQSREPIGLSGGRLADALSELFLFQRAVIEQIKYDIFELIDWINSFGANLPGEVPVSKNIPQPRKIVRFRDKYMAEKRNYLSGYDASEGALYILFMVILIHHRNSPGLFAVDNFDHALNPRLACSLTKKLCGWIKELGTKQIILTSHNPSVLDGLPLQDNDIRLFTVERNNKGKTVINRVLIDEDLIKNAQNGIPLSQQWVMGNFGGVPNI